MTPEMRATAVSFYNAVEAFGMADCDDTIFCACGATWEITNYNQGTLRRVLNGVRLHRTVCKERS